MKKCDNSNSFWLRSGIWSRASYSLWMIFPQKLLLSEHAHDRRIHPLCTGIPKWLCCTFFQTTQIESKRKNNPLCLMTLLSEQSYNPLAVKVRQPRQRTMYTKYIMLYYMCTYLSRQSHHRGVPRCSGRFLWNSN